MSQREAFTFGIPLIAKSASNNWPLVEALLNLTLTSLRAQTHSDARIVIAGHDEPEVSAERGVDFLRADWAAEAVRMDNLDSGRKKSMISADVAARGGGLLMFVDADDWIETRLVEIARSTIRPDQIGGIITAGDAFDIRSLRTIALPHAGLFDAAFHRLCGSSIVARYDVHAKDAVRRDPFAIMHEHYRWIDACREHGLAWQALEARATYVVNTTANHSETFGPFRQWRRDLSEGIAREGHAASDASLAGFGLSVEQVRSVHRFL